MIGRGVVGALTIDWPSLMRFKRTFTDPIRTRQERRYADQGVDTFHGLARFKEHYASWIVFCFDRSGPNQSFRRSEEHTSELQSLMRISYAGFCLKKKKMIDTTYSNRREGRETHKSSNTHIEITHNCKH